MNRERGIPNVEGAIDDVRAGRMVVLVDDEDRENEGDLCMAAERVTPEAVNFMATFGRGLICLPMTEERIRQLDLAMMVHDNQARMGTAFTVSIEAKSGVTTGISAADRAHTIQVAVAPGAKSDDLVRPGHVFPLRARAGGVLQRSGQTEGAVDLARLAGLVPAGVICEIMNDDGTMARMPDLERFAERHELRIVTIAELIEYRMQKERLVRRVAEADLRFEGLAGAYRAFAYEATTGGRFLAIVRGDVGGTDAVLCRVHTGCLTGDVFGSRTCDCGAQLRAALAAIEAEGRGVVLYLPPNPDIGREIERHVLHKSGTSADPGPELREFGLGAQVLRDLGLGRIRLLTNNPRKIVGLEGFGLDIVERVPHQAAATADNVALLEEKRDRLGHLIDLSKKRA